MSTNVAPKTFISYNWGNQENQMKIIEFATKLRTLGIDVILDKWDLKEGQDKYFFMEKMASEAQKVLVICDKEYMEKANSRKGGVGTEGQIISADIYEKVDQTKFIPVIFEFHDGQPCVPVFLKNRIYINLSDESNVDELEKLVRAIHDKPLHVKPPLGEAPSFILERNETVIKTSGTYSLLLNSIEQFKPNSSKLTSDFLDIVFQAIKDEQFNILSKNEEHSYIYDQILAFKPYTDHYISIVNNSVKLKSFNPNIYIEFFEKLLGIYTPFNGINSWREYRFDYVKFLTREMFLQTLTILKTNNEFDHFNEFLNHVYFVSSEAKQENQFFCEICDNLEALDKLKNHDLGDNRASVTADLLHDRNPNNIHPFLSVIETDYLLWLRCMRINIRDDRNKMWWFPVTMVYLKFHSGLPLFIKAESKKFFSKLTVLLGVNSKVELNAFVKTMQETKQLDQWRVGRSWRALPLVSVLNLEKLDTL